MTVIQENKNQFTVPCKPLVIGQAEGSILESDTSLSLWGGVNPKNGLIIDKHHPLCGQCVTGKIFVLPSGRGSCSGSGVVLELLLSGKGPAAFIFERDESIVPLGIMIASELFGVSVPAVQVSSDHFETICISKWARITGNEVSCGEGPCSTSTALNVKVDAPVYTKEKGPIDPSFKLTSFDREVLNGDHGIAAQIAARVVLNMAIIQGAKELIDIKHAHLGTVTYTGPASVRFALRLEELGAKVRIPSSLNSTFVDNQRWRSQGIDPATGDPATALAEAYVKMGAQPSYTCAPYLLESVPLRGDQVIWSESNAVVFANSVLGARTIKCPDYLDICVALTGRAPNSGCHIAENRQAQIQISIPRFSRLDDSFYPVLGYSIGDIAANRIPIITGLENMAISIDDLKAFGAAFATTGSAPMFHIAGHTPEAKDHQDIEMHLSAASIAEVTHSSLAKAWLELDNGSNTQIDLVSLGSPHFSYEEFVVLADLCQGRKRHAATPVVVTCGREIYSKAYKDGYVSALEEFGVQTVTDTCWCFIGEPLIPVNAKTLMTNSGKFAHYGAGLTGHQMRFGSMAQCVEAACNGHAGHVLPRWLQQE